MIGSHDGGGAQAPEADYTNSSLVKIGEGVAVYAAYHDDRIVEQVRESGLMRVDEF